MDSENRPLIRQLLNFWCDSFPSGWVGRRLARYFALAGLVDVQVQPETLVLRQFELADQVLDLVQTAHAARESGLASEAAVQGWLDEMAERDRRREFFSSFTAFIVSGTKP